MGVTFNGKPCLDPGVLASQCQSKGLPLNPWFGFCNRYAHPIGLRPGYGAVLLTWQSILDTKPGNGRFKLEFTAMPQGGSLEKETFTNLRVVGTPIAVTPGYPGDPNTAMFVELADRRVDCVGLCGKRYNWRIHADCTYETASLNSGTAWTWTTLLTDLWNAVGNLGTFPTLPVTPAGVPEQIDGMGCRAADLLEDLLLLNSMGVKYNPSVDEFTIVSFVQKPSGFWGDVVSTNQIQGTWDLLKGNDNRKIWDIQPTITKPSLPAYVRVVFPVWSPGGTPIDTASYYVVDVADTGATATQYATDAYALVQDFLPCRTNQQGTVLNGSNLVSRAADVAANYYKVARQSNCHPLHKVYSGVGQGLLVRPGQVIDVVCWEDLGNGPKTHVIQTGRLGFGPMFRRVGSLYSSGSLLTGNPFGAATNYYRDPIASTDSKDPIKRVANMPPGEMREYQTGPMATASGSSAAVMAGGGGVSSIMDKVGPLRQWDAAVQARSVDGHGQRLWLAKKRTQHNCWVRVTSVTADGTTGYYPAIETFFDPDKDAKTWTEGDVCWFYSPNSETPVDETRYWCSLQGSDGEATSKKVYMATPTSGTELKGMTFTSDTGSTSDADNGNGLMWWNNATQANATVLYFDNLTADAIASSTFFASLGPNGFIYLQQADDSTKWQKWKWYKVTAGVGYYKFTVVLQANGGTIADAKTLYTKFSPLDVELTGLTFEADTGSTADSDPGNGLMKWNNGTQASATKLFFDNQTIDGVTCSGFHAALSQSGILYIQQSDDRTRWQMWKWTAATSAAGYYKYDVTSLATSANPIEDGKIIYTDFDNVPVSPTPTTAITFSGARVYNSAHHSNLGSVSIEDVTFDSEDFDTDTYHSTVSNTARLTVPSTGYYQVGCNLAISPITPDINQLMSVALAHNGSTNIGHWEANDFYAATGTMLYHCCITTIWYASASDYFTVRVDGQGVGGVKVWFLDKSEPVFWIQRLGT